MPRFFSVAFLGLCAAAAFSASAVAAPARSGAPTADEQVVVKYSPADLHTAKGAHSLALRIRIAAAKVCGSETIFAYPNNDGFIRCRETAIDNAVKGLDAPLVAQALGRQQTTLARNR
jgi:UrcA family protein